MARFDELPPEILNIICEFFSLNDLMKLTAVNRKLYTVATSPKLWQHFQFVQTDPTKLKFLITLERLSQVKSFIIKRSMNRTMWSQLGPKLSLPVLGGVVEKFEEIDLSGVDLSKKQVVFLFEKVCNSRQKVLKKLRIFSKFDFVAAETFGKSLCMLEQVDLGYHRIKESHQENLFLNMTRSSSIKSLLIHDNISQGIPSFLVANALKNLEELSMFGMSKAQTNAFFEELVKSCSLKAMSMDNKNLKHVPAHVLTKVVLMLESVDLFDHLTEVQTAHLFEELASDKSVSKLKNLRLVGYVSSMVKVKPSIFASALSRIEEVDISYSNLLQPYKNSLFSTIKGSRVRKLNMMSVNLSSVPAVTLGRAILGLEEVELSYTNLNSEQVNIIFELMGGKENRKKLKLLNLVGNNLRSISPYALAEGFNSVEATNLSDTRIERDQVEALLEVMVQNTRLKRIKMDFSDVCQYEDSLVADARRKGVVFIIEEADE